MGTSCFLNRIQKAQSTKGKMVELYPLLGLQVSMWHFSGWLQCICPTSTDANSHCLASTMISRLLSSFPALTLNFDSSGVTPGLAALSPQCCVLSNCFFLPLTATLPISFCTCPDHPCSSPSLAVCRFLLSLYVSGSVSFAFS